MNNNQGINVHRNIYHSKYQGFNGFQNHFSPLNSPVMLWVHGENMKLEVFPLN
jgi:hypothetical protein